MAVKSHAGAPPETWLGRRLHAIKVVGPVAGFVVVPVVLWCFLVASMLREDAVAVDFRTYLGDAEALLAGEPTSGQPPLLAILAMPFTLLPVGVAEIVVTVLMVLCAVAIPVVLGVRDWRCYGAMALWAPVYSGIQTANVSLVLALGLALVWRWRDRPLLSGATIAVVAALKVFLWPLALWPLITRRWAAAAVTAAVGVVGALVAMAFAGSPAQIADGLLGGIDAYGVRSYSVASWFVDLGLSTDVGYAASGVLGAGLIVAAARAGRRRSATSFTLLVSAALVLSPVLWPHYLCLLLPPLAIAAPRLRWFWVLPLAIIVCAPGDKASTPDRLVFAVVAVVLVTCILRELSDGARSTAARSTSGD